MTIIALRWQGKRKGPGNVFANFHPFACALLFCAPRCFVENLSPCCSRPEPAGITRTRLHCTQSTSWHINIATFQHRDISKYIFKLKKKKIYLGPSSDKLSAWTTWKCLAYKTYRICIELLYVYCTVLNTSLLIAKWHFMRQDTAQQGIHFKCTVLALEEASEPFWLNMNFKLKYLCHL